MDIQAEKLKVIEKLLQTQNEIILDQVKAILEDDGKDHWEELPEPVKNSIKKAEDQIEKGEVKPHEQVISEVKKRFLK
jgi:hypothetical protein